MEEGKEYYFRVCVENKKGVSEFLEIEKFIVFKSLFGKFYFMVFVVGWRLVIINKVFIWEYLKIKCLL